MLTGSSGTRLLDGRRRDRGLGFTSSLSLSRRFCLLSSPTFLGASTHFGSTFLLLALLRLMLVGIWAFGLDFIQFIGYYFLSSDHYNQSSVQYLSKFSIYDARAYLV